MRRVIVALAVLLPLTVAGAAHADPTTKQFLHYLATKYHQRKPLWAVCPKVERQQEPKLAHCQAQFPLGGNRWRSVTVEILPHGKTALGYSNTWVRKWHLCQQGPVFGKLVANAPMCSSYYQMIGDLEDSLYHTRPPSWPKALFVHGTNGAGFEAVVEYKCNHSNVRRTSLGLSGTVQCTDALGDSLRYTFPTD